MLKIRIPKASIIGMLLNSHYLNSIITKLFDSRKHLISKVDICVDLWLLHLKVKKYGEREKKKKKMLLNLRT